MQRDLEERYKNSMVNEYTKEQLAEMVMKRNERICDMRSFINQIFSGTSGVVLNDCIEKLEVLGENALSKNLDSVRKYLSCGNKYLHNWTE